MMLEKRIYTALLLVGGLVLALMQLSPESVSLLFLAVAAAGAWEWAARQVGHHDYCTLVALPAFASIIRASMPRYHL